MAGGQAVRLVQGAAGSETSYGDPVEAALAWQSAGRGVAAPGRPGRRLRPRVQRRPAGRGHRQARHQGRAVRRHPRRRVAGAGAGHRLRPGQHRHRRPGETRLGGARSSPSTASKIAVGLDVRGTDPGRPRLDRARAATSTRRSPASTPRAAPGTWSPTSSRTACSAGPTWTCYRDVCARTDAPVVASGGVSSLDDLRALAVADRARGGGRDRRQGPLRRRVHPGRGARGGGGMSEPAASGSTVPGNDARAPARRLCPRRVTSGVPFEQAVGYSRAVAAGDFIFVSGCTSIADGKIVHEGDLARQTEQALLNVSAALEQLGASLADVGADPDVRHRHLPLGGGRRGAPARVRAGAAGHHHGAGGRADRPAAAGRGGGGGAPRGRPRRRRGGAGRVRDSPGRDSAGRSRAADDTI